MTEKVRHDTQIAFITIMSPEGTRYTHTDPSLIGQTYLGTTEPALRGETFSEVFTGTLGPSIRAVAPVYASDGRIVGLVSAGITQQTLAENWYAQLPLILLVAATAALAAVVGMWLVRRRLMRQTGGLSPRDLRVMYEHHDAVLHSISEGLVVVEGDRAVLINDEARRLLAVTDAVPIEMRSLPAFLADGEALNGDGPEDPNVKDEVRVTKDRVLVVNRAPVAMGQRSAADVVTIRDRTELQGALGELDSMKVFAESLRSQAHEAANRLHTIVALVEMGRGDEAVRFATTELELSQRLVDRLTASVQEPALVALLLGKSAQAAERGIALTVTDDTHLGADELDRELGGVLTPTEMVTVVGNLVDNALDACDKDDPWVEVTVRQDDAALRIVVADSGSGMDAVDVRAGPPSRVLDQGGRRGRASGARPRTGRSGGPAARRAAHRRGDLRFRRGRDDRPRRGGKAPLVIRVLVVEDEPLIAEAHQAYLSRVGGYEVVAVVSTAREAVRQASSAIAADRPIDLVLLDIGLPDHSGIELASTLSGMRPTPDIIAITSERDLAVVRAAVAHGVLIYLLKPFTFGAFRDKLERYQRYRDALGAGGDAVSQRDVDAAMAELRAVETRGAAPKGVAPETTDEIARLVRDATEGMTASEVAGSIGVSRVTAWRYLERLADDNVVTRTSDYGRAGRPQVRYRWRR